MAEASIVTFFSRHPILEILVGLILLAIAYLCQQRVEGDPNWLLGAFFQDDETPFWRLAAGVCCILGVILLGAALNFYFGW